MMGSVLHLYTQKLRGSTASFLGDEFSRARPALSWRIKLYEFTATERSPPGLCRRPNSQGGAFPYRSPVDGTA